MDIRLKRVANAAKIPAYQTAGAAGFDLFSVEDAVLQPGAGAIVATGIAVELPDGYEIQVRGRSGLGFTDDIIAHFGTIDADYRGEIRVKLWNLGVKAFTVTAGMRIAQGVLNRVERACFIESGELSETKRGDKGYGHTGR